MMDNAEAIRFLEEALEEFRQEPYETLARRIEAEPVRTERGAAAGTTYQLEFLFLWDGAAGGNVRVMGSIDDGGWRAFLPLTRSFIKAPDESFVGEETGRA